MRIGWEHFHIHTNLSKYVNGGCALDSWYLAQERHFFLDRLHVTVDFLVDILYLTFEVLDALADGTKHELMMFREVAFHSKGDFLP